MSVVTQELTNEAPPLLSTLERSVTVTARLDPLRGMTLSIPADQLYINVPVGNALTITYNLVVDGPQNVIFDQPPITVSNSSAPLISRPSNTVGLMTIDNTTWQAQGASFYYTIRAIWIQSDSVQIPVNLDPTVHNDPPS